MWPSEAGQRYRAQGDKDARSVPRSSLLRAAEAGKLARNGARSESQTCWLPVDSSNDEPKPIPSEATTPMHFGFISLQTSSRD